jgi:outer membrane receptor protein involved in Fe transport
VEEDITESGSSLSADVESDLGKAKTNLQFYSSTHDFTMSPAVWWGTAVSRQSEYGVRFSVAAELSREVEFGAGLELGRAGFSGNLLAPAVLQRQDNTSALYASLGIRPAPQFGLDLGLRYEDVRWALDKVVQPRAVLSWYAADGFTFKAGYRRHYQHSYGFLRNSCASFLFDQQYDDYRLFETGALSAKRADHYSLSAELTPALGTRLSLEGYLKEYSSLPTWRLDEQGLPYDVGNAGGGFARGAELTCEQQLAGGWTGWLTYALSWTRKRQGTDTMMYWDKYDRRNSVNAVVEKRWGDDWALTATFHLNTGAPYTPLLHTRSPGGAYGSDLNRGHSAWVIEGDKNSARVPVYHRLDLKLRRDLPKLPLHPFLYIEVINIYNQQNAYNLVQFEDRDGNIVTGQSTGIPLTPLVGIGGRF